MLTDEQMSEKYELFKIANIFYKVADMNFVNISTHIKVVMDLFEGFKFNEDLTDHQIRVLENACLLHDIGLACCKLPKIVESDFEGLEPLEREKLKNQSVNARMEHMRIGELIAVQILETSKLTYLENLYCCGLIVNHDITKVVAITKKDGEYYKDLERCFTNSLWQLLNEIDALWMLTDEGIKTDIERSKQHGKKPMSFEEQLKYNTELHYKRYDLYKELGLDVSNFINKSMYRSEFGYEMFEQLKSKEV